MKRLLALAISVLVVISACSKKSGPQPVVRPAINADSLSAVPFYADTLLPETDPHARIRLVDSARIIRPNEAESRLGSLLPEYLKYRFAGMVSATYDVEDVAVSVEIAQFGSLEDAYGHYALLRPFGAALGALGGESYESGPHLFITGRQYTVTLSVEDTAAPKLAARNLLAGVINTSLATNKQPPFFLLFPSARQVAASQRYYPFDFAGVPGLDTVYCITYEIEGDTAQMFLTVDRSGQKYLRLREYGQAVGQVSLAPSSIPYEGGHSQMFEDPKHGVVVAGLIRAKVVGVVGFKPSHERLLALWVKGLE